MILLMFRKIEAENKNQKIFKKDLAKRKCFSTFAPRYESNEALKKKDDGSRPEMKFNSLASTQ